MLTISILLLAALAVMALFPRTRVARTFRHWLVQAPARALNRTNVWRMAFYSALIGAGIAMTMLFEAEGAIVYGFMAPEIFAWAILFDVGVLIDALLITGAILASNGLRVARMQVRALAGRAVKAIRKPGVSRSHSPRPAPRPIRKSADDDRPRGWAQPAYLAFSMA